MIYDMIFRSSFTMRNRNSIATVAACICGIMITSAETVITLADEPSSEYIAQWRDGTIKQATVIDGWVKSKEGFGRGKAATLDDASISGRPLYDANNQIRLLRNTKVQAMLIGPYIELANGDILPGKIVGMSGKTGANSPAWVSVAVASPLFAMSENQAVRILATSISRVAANGNQARPFTPGLVVYTDGREVVAKAIKWTPAGLQLLLARSAEVVSWDKLAEFHVHDRRSSETVTDDLKAQRSGMVNLLARMTTKSGGMLTCHCLHWAGAKVGWNYFHVLQPAWSKDRIFVPVGNIVSVGYREVNEVPLSLLDAETLVERNLTGFTWQWQRDRNVRGTPLAVGNHSAEFGVGTHAHSEIAFTLPRGSHSFSCWLGIDKAVGQGGCVRCKVFLDKVQGAPAWQSKVIRGGDEPVLVEVHNLQSAKHLILVTEFADSDHPPDADPLDIGDAVAWLSAHVRVDDASTSRE